MESTSNKTVCCVMPVYNYARYLQESLESVFSQTRVPDEIIIVDDCSTDNIREILFEGDRLRYPVTYIRHDTNKGLAAARNTGIRACKSEYCFSFDADDILRPQAVEKHLEIADENSIVTMALMAFGGENYTAYPREATIPILLKTNCIYSNSLFPKKMWEDVGGFDEHPTMKLGWEDRLFWLEALGKGYKSKVGNYVALLWRRHPKSMSSTTANPNAEILQEYIYNKCKHLE